MGPLLVVGDTPVVGDRLTVCDGFADPGVEDLVAIRGIEALDVDVLVGFARLDVEQLDAVMRWSPL